MADDPQRDFFPTKEGQSFATDINVSEKYASPERRHVPHLSRTDLEDQFYRFKEENFQLKKATKQQEDNLKRLATKMTRLLREKKTMELNHSPGHKRDLELEEMVEDLQDKVRQLERTNTHLREKALVAKQQVILQTRRPNPYSHIPPKVNSGNNRSWGMPYSSSVNLRAKSIQNLSRKSGGTPIPPYALSLLEEARTELSNLKILVTNQRNEIDMYQQENELFKQNMRMREIEFDEELNILKSQLTQRQRQHVQENLDLIRLHREVKQKNSKILSMQSQHSEMEEKMRMLKLNHDHLVKDMDELSLRFRNEQKKNLELLGEVQKAEITFSASSEFQERIKTLMKENEVLRETNDTLIKSALGMEKEKSFHQLEQVFKDRISNLETSLEFQTKAKTSLEEQLCKEKGELQSKDEACNMLKVQVAQMASHIEELEIRMSFLKSENLDFDDLKEAIDLLKLYRAGKFGNRNETKKDDDSVADKENVENSSEKSTVEQSSETVNEAEELIGSEVLKELEDMHLKLKESEEDRNEAMQELEKVRDLLAASQSRSSEATQEEMRLLSEKVEEQQRVYQAQLNEYSQLLENRNTRIEKLERQLNDIAYGTTSFNIEESSSMVKNVHPVQLSRGENIFEIHFVKVELSQDGLKCLTGPNSKVFLTWNFYEFPLQSTPVVPFKKSHFNFTAQYTIQVDDFFLFYLHESPVALELHESVGEDYKTIASCQIHFSSIFTKSKGPVNGTQRLTGIFKGCEIDFGTVEFWIKFKIPMEETFKLFKEKVKALKYIHSNKETSTVATHHLKKPSHTDAHNNELHIKILRAINVQSRQKDAQPNTYCIYKFYGQPDQDTCIIPSSNHPEYSHHHVFRLNTDAALEKYLRTETLYVYVFDDNDPDISSPIGRASISLKPLALNDPVKGIFQLSKDGKTECGSIEVSLYWQYKYSLAPETSLQNKDRFVPEAPPFQLSSEEESAPEDFVATPPVPKPRTHLPRKITAPQEFDDSSSSDEDHTYGLSPKLSPLNEKQQEIPEPSKRFIQSTGNANDTTSEQDKWSDVMSNTERKASYEETSGQEEKQHFYEDSEETGSEDEDYSPKLSSKVPSIVIQVSHLQFRAEASILDDPLVKLLYVEYRFLDYPLEELETPFSLPKKPPPNTIEFNFRKEFQLQLKDLEKWNLLAKMFLPDSPESSSVHFTVVSEPASDDQNLECEDIGYGSVDLCEILKNGKDIINKDISIFDARDTTTVIGHLHITIQALEALQLLHTFADL